MTDDYSSGGPVHQTTVSDEDAGQRLDRYLASQLPDYSRTRLQGLIKAGQVKLSGRAIDNPGHKVKAGETYCVEIPEPVEATPQPQAIDLDVVYEDDHLIVINKPAGLVVHPAAGHGEGTLVNALLAHCGDSLSGIGGVRRPGIVHRLDKDTSGLMVVAKTDAAHAGLSEQFALHGADGRLSRRYIAVVWGAPPLPQGSIDARLGRSTINRLKIAVQRGDAGRHAVTHYKLLQTYFNAGGKALASQVECTLETGRTHQIRVHMAHIGHPLLGDNTYGAGFAASARNLPAAAQDALNMLGRQALHAMHLGFTHPSSDEQMSFDAAPPPGLARLIEALKPDT